MVCGFDFLLWVFDRYFVVDLDRIGVREMTAKKPAKAKKRKRLSKKVYEGWTHQYEPVISGTGLNIQIYKVKKSVSYGFAPLRPRRIRVTVEFPE